MMNVLQAKIQAIRSAGVDQLHVICDFDRTLTTFTKGGSSFSPVRRLGLLTEEYAEKAMALFYHYHPLELDPLIPHEEKSGIMHEWWEAQFHLMIQEGFKKEHLELMKGQDMIQLRPGVVEFMKEVSEMGVPMLVLSAGFGDMIEIVLEEAGVYTPNVHVVANFMEYAESGAAIGYAPPIIHGLNKCEQELGPYRDEVALRPNVLLVGDMLGDANMADGLPHDTVLKIGYFNSMDDETRPHYFEAFDVVIEGDESWEKVSAVWRQLTNNNKLL